MNIQSLIDKEKYPPTQDYDFTTLQPRGPLKERMLLINKICPNFFDGQEFLDIGTNKGYFALLAAKKCKKVVGIDTGKNFIDLCLLFPQPNLYFHNESFRDFIYESQFDRAFIGNVMHYVFVDANGWDWVYKLATLIKKDGIVIIEGPFDFTCEDVKSVIPKHIAGDWSKEKFYKNIGKFFEILTCIPTVSYTPNRYLTLLKRKKDINEFQLSELPATKVIKENEYGKVFISKINNEYVVVKIINYGRNKNRISMARFSPISNGLVGSVFKDDEFVGWVEAKHQNDAVYGYKENQEFIFSLICKHQVFLSRNNYIDHDFSMINFFKDNNKLFDKGLVHPIKTLNDTNCDVEAMGVFGSIKNSYNMSRNQMLKISEILKTRDSKLIEDYFNKATLVR